MFGYIIVNKQELKFREFDLYRSYYCGFCRELKRLYGKRGQMTLSYDLTFLILLLTSLYEKEPDEGVCRCIAHPLEKHLTRRNEFTGYAADMNLLLAYYKCEDDWLDERKLKQKAFWGLLKKRAAGVEDKYPAKAKVIREALEAIHRCEAAGSRNIDEISGWFGNVMAEIFALRQDEWERDLRRMGFFLGKFIYLMDAYEDIEKDKKDGNYNPLSGLYGTPGFEEGCEGILTMMMAECSKAFEKLPLLEYAEILRNILYSGVWCRYETVKAKRAEEKAKAAKEAAAGQPEDKGNKQ